ncbi:MAG: ABC transporter ATP-binding protein [Candidatus Delongbacteria bacterium]|jgi:subfamily B ATP-binding cassette protein MsbA|nr:ABC transporter ATP-binding protein [Candidatus Delongbacteria bacterium]
MENIKKIFKIALRYWKLMILGFFTMTLFALFGSISVTLAIPLFDHVFGEKAVIIYADFNSFIDAIVSTFDKEIIYNSFSSIFSKSTYTVFFDQINLILKKTDPFLLLKIISISLVTLIAIKNVFYYANRIVFVNLRGKTVRDIRTFIYKKYLYQSYAFFSKNRVGDSLVRIFSDVQVVNNLFIGSLFNAIRDLLTVLFLAGVALMISPKLFFISLTIVPIFTYLVGKIGKKVKKYAKRIQRESANMFSSIEETLNGIKIVKAFSKEEREYKRFYNINSKYFNFWRKSEIYSAANVPLSEINGVVTAILILIIGGQLMFAEGSTFSPGSFFAFLGAILSMLHPFKTLSKAFNDMKKAMVSLDRISEIMNNDSEVKEIENPIKIDKFEESLEFKNVSFTYNGKDKVLDNISFKITKGQKIALVGNSGSGKTTLTNLLSRMYDVTSGEILIDNTNIKNFSIKKLRSLFGTVTQDTILFNETIKNNIGYGSNENIDDEVIINAAKIAYADEFIDKLPNKYDEMLNVKANNLSGGQKQRLCIARAIVGNPPILIFDEATSALDTESERKVQIAIEQATENKTVIVVAHRLSTVLSSDQIVVFDDGKIVGIGKSNDLLQTCDKYKMLYELQFQTNTPGM